MEESSKFRKTILGSIFSNFSREAATSIGQLALTPLYISRFGTNDYAVWLLLMAYTSFVVLSDFGLSTAVIVKLQSVDQIVDVSKIKIWGHYKKFTFALALGISTLVLCVTGLNFDMNEGSKLNHRSYLFLTILFIFLAFQTLRQHNYLYRMQLLKIYNKGMQNLFYTRVLEILVLALGLYYKFTMIQLLILNIAIRELLLYLSLKSMTSRLSTLTQVKGEIFQASLAQVVRPATGNGLFSMSVVLGIHGSFALASTWLSATSLVILSLTRMLVSPIRILSGSLLQGSLPHFIRLETDTESRVTSNYFIKFIMVSAALIFCSALAILATSKLIWSFLSDESLNFSGTLVCLFMLSVAMDSVCAFRLQLPTIRNQSLRFGSIFFASTILSLMLQVFFSNQFDLLAVPLSIIVADIIFLVCSLLLGRATK